MKWEIAWDVAYVSIGAIAGALLRYKVTGEGLFVSGLPVSVLMINVLGSFILGLSATAATQFGSDPRLTLLVGIGFCGSLTTMSSFAFETANLLDTGKFLIASADVLLNVGASIGAIFLGRALLLLILGATG
jgi:fluoride exporter